MLNKKEYFIGCRVTEEEYSNLGKLMDAMEYENASKFLRKMIKTMVKHAQEKGLF